MTELLINATMIVNRGHKLIILVRQYVQNSCVISSLLRSSKYWWLMKAYSGVSKDKCIPF